MKNKLLFLIGLGILITGYMFIVVRPGMTPAKPTVTDRSPKESISITQTVFTPNNPGNIPTTIAIEKGKTALDLLQKTAKVQLKGRGAEAFVTSINDTVASEKNKQFWAFYINGSQAQIGAGSYQLQDNDKIEWKLETY